MDLTKEQALRFDEVLHKILSERSISVNKINEVFPANGYTLSIRHIIQCLLKDEYIEYLSTTGYAVTGKGLIFLESGGYPAQIAHREKMDSITIESAKQNEENLSLTRESLILAEYSLRLNKTILAIAIIGTFLTLVGLIISIYCVLYK